MIFKLLVALPSLQQVDADFALGWVPVVMAMTRHKVPGYENQIMDFSNKRSSLLPKSRHELVKDALAGDYTHILFVDSDQTFPSSIVHRLARYGKNIIGCNVATKRQGGSYPTARAKPKNDSEWFAGHMVYSNGKKGLERVWRLGFGVMLINLEVFRKIEKPWFMIEYVEKVDDYIGEDWFFCRKAEEAGFDIWVDHDLSREIGHVGPWIYSHQDVEPEPTQDQLRSVA